MQQLQESWIRDQVALRSKVMQHDSVDWVLPNRDGTQVNMTATRKPLLRLVGGLDISFFPDPQQQQQQQGAAAPQSSGSPPVILHVQQQQQQHQGQHQGQLSSTTLEGCALLPVIQDAQPQRGQHTGLLSLTMPQGVAPLQEIQHVQQHQGRHKGQQSSTTLEGSALLPGIQHAQLHQGQKQSQQQLTGVAGLVVLSYPDLEPVYEDFELIPRFPCPYIPGFLAYREMPFYLTLLERAAKAGGGIYYPQVVLVDGCGRLHPERFGSACHLGVVADVPTIGVSKNLYSIEGLERSAIETAFAQHWNGVQVQASVHYHEQQQQQQHHELQHHGNGKQQKQQQLDKLHHHHDYVQHNKVQRYYEKEQDELQHHNNGQQQQQQDKLQHHHDNEQQPQQQHQQPHNSDTKLRKTLQDIFAHHDSAQDVVALPSGQRVFALRSPSNNELLGAALCGPASKKPVYVSVGHRISLTTALEIVMTTSKYRMPEPLRAADLRSRAIINSTMLQAG